LNVVIGIDQVRDMMSTLKRSPRNHERDPITVDGQTRLTIQAAVGVQGAIFFPFGSQVAQVRAMPGNRLLFVVFTRDFPIATEPATVIEDLPAGDTSAFGALGRVWFGSQRGLKGYDLPSLDSDAAAQAARLLDALRADVAGHLAYRAVRDQSASSRQSDDRAHRLATDLARVAASRADLQQNLAELGERLGLQGTDTGVRFASLIAPPLPSQVPVVGADSRSLVQPPTASSSGHLPVIGATSQLAAVGARPGGTALPPTGPPSKP
jgi:hypothetical protein